MTTYTGPAGTGRLLSIDLESVATFERDGEQLMQHLHTGMRAACLGSDPRDPTKAIIAVEGGIADFDGLVPDSVMFTLSERALDAFADLLRETAAKLREANTIDMRHVI